MSANAIINLVSSLAGLIGPVLGGALFALSGIMPTLYISVGCFFFSTIMEIFIKIPFIKTKNSGNIFSTGFTDLKESFHFIKSVQPSIWKVSLIISAINLFLSLHLILRIYPCRHLSSLFLPRRILLSYLQIQSSRMLPLQMAV